MDDEEDPTATPTISSDENITKPVSTSSSQSSCSTEINVSENCNEVDPATINPNQTSNEPEKNVSPLHIQPTDSNRSPQFDRKSLAREENVIEATVDTHPEKRPLEQKDELADSTTNTDEETTKCDELVPEQELLPVQDTGTSGDNSLLLEISKSNEEESKEQTIKHKSNGNLSAERIKTGNSNSVSCLDKSLEGSTQDLSQESNEVDSPRTNDYDDDKHDSEMEVPFSEKHHNMMDEEREHIGEGEHQFDENSANETECHIGKQDTMLDYSSDEKHSDNKQPDTFEIKNNCTTTELHVNGEVSNDAGHTSDEIMEDINTMSLKRPRSVSPAYSNKSDIQEPSNKLLKKTDETSLLGTETSDVVHRTDPETVQQIRCSTELIESNERLNQSIDSGKSSLEDSNEPEEEAAPSPSTESVLSQVKSQPDLPSAIESTIEDDDLDDDKSSTSSSSSSSSSSSDSDSSDDEVKEDEGGEAGEDKSDIQVQNKLPLEELEQTTSEQIPLAPQESDCNNIASTEAEPDDDRSRSRLNLDESCSLSSGEYEEPEDELEEAAENENGAKITKSEGLKLSISLKRPVVEGNSTPLMDERLPPVVVPMPVDFSNFLNLDKIFGERSELIKIDYNSKPPVHNISDQVQEMETNIHTAETIPAASYSLLGNQLKTNYVGINSADFVGDESSDTLDEDNRLVIAEKQRRGKKKDNSPTKQPHMQLQEPWNPIGYQLPVIRPGTATKSTAKRSYQQRPQQSLMKTMLASSKISQPHLPIPPALPPQTVSDQQTPLQQPVAPHQPEKKKDKKKVFLCSPCGIHFENWNLFKHMREVHKKYICLYCLGIFQSAERLVTHLDAKHQVRRKHFATIHEYQQQQTMDIGKALYLMCARCEHIFEKTSPGDEQSIVQHDCANYLDKCNNCGGLKQSKHKCEKKVNLLASTHNAGNNISSVGNMNSSVKLNINNYDNRTSGSSTAVMFNYDNQPNSNANHNKQNQMNVFTGHPTHQSNRKPPSKKARINQKQPLVDLNAKLLHPSSDQQAEPTHGMELMDRNFISPILQSRLMKPLDSITTLSCPTELFQPQSSLQKSLDHHPSKQWQDKTKIPKLSFNQTTTISTIPASLLNVTETPTELPPVPELPPHDEIVSRPPLVPKLKVKIPKQFCTPIESEDSTTESDGNEVDDDDDDDDDEVNEEEDSGETEVEQTPILAENSLQQAPVEHPKDAGTSTNRRVEDDVKLDPVEMDIEEEGERQPVNLPPEMGPAPMPLQHRTESDNFDLSQSKTVDEIQQSASSVQNHLSLAEPTDSESAVKHESPSDGIVIADEDSQLFELTLDEPLDKIHIRDFVKICLRSTIPFCLYCNHARRIAVNGKYLALHLIATHRFQATVNSITAEELLPATIVLRFKSSLEELESLFFNLETFDSSWTAEQKAVTYAKQFECFQCRFITTIHKELYLHNRKMHQKSVLICLMCRANFFSYSELLCHMCPGAPNQLGILDYTFRCSLCSIDGIPSAFRLMVHLRKRHFACDVCLEQCAEQGALSNHVWKHKLHHLCYRCGIAYRNKADILKHLFWKHGTEGVMCKRCLQKKWPHVYHFCVPPAQFICDVCQMGFRKSLALKVHQRLHNGEEKYPCTEDGCEKKFISKKLLLKHVQRHYEPVPPPLLSPKVSDPTPEPESVPKPKIEVQENPVADTTPLNDEPSSGRVKMEVKEEKNDAELKESAITPRKKKKKRSKDDNEKPLTDLINLPALNLSESDSSDNSDAENSNSSSKKFTSALATLSETSDDEGILTLKKEESKAAEATENQTQSGTDQVLVIWNNLKNSQASITSRRSSLVEDIGEEQFIEKLLKTKILHVSQSDHDYCRMMKKVYPQVKAEAACETIVIDDDGNLESVKKQESLLKTSVQGGHSKKQKSPRKRKPSKSGSDSSSSGSGSDSDSSCECGSNCSCSSSSSGSSSSSSNDSDTSDENAAKNKIKEVADRLGEVKEEQQKAEEPPDETVKPTEPIDPDTIIHESDLETDESDTDEEFYDDHPQKLANQMLAEKRRQLLQQTCMSPMNSYGIVENSRPSTPSLPPEELDVKKKVKLKKRKRERKISKKTSPQMAPKSQVNIPPQLNLNQVDQFPSRPMHQAPPLSAPPMFHPLESPKITSSDHSAPSTPSVVSGLKSSSKILSPRLSTGHSSESDAPLKRSQRSRKPNKFYGYTSDDELPSAQTPLSSKNPEKSILSVMKPTPPPNLVWSKDDLPSPPIVKSRTPKLKQSEHHTPVTSRVLPPVITPVQQPPQVVTTRIPQAPVHHIHASPIGTPHQADADSDSSQEGVLQISQKSLNATTPHRPLPPLPKLKLSISKKTPARGTQKKTPGSRKRAATKSKTPKSAPPTMPAVTARALTSDLAKPAIVTAPPFEPPIVDTRIPKVPPLGSFPSITTEFFPPNQIRIPAGWRPPREGESVYCYCRCPYDEVSEMIACDGDNCRIEWFHFECVGIIMPPKGKWFCPECKMKQQGSGTEPTPFSIGTGSSTAAIIPAAATLGGGSTRMMQ
ncbi:uncharacterized protein LOC131433818 [Malaya genurostris]|uniref:uncharacterized protein LOC131433818 n=1 Tax=Malaya genurostris TaxID=325434 RepID=UPI0026F3E218|nr:uncharacterized protein LOC131433818 [Malaya genurostris]XP_058456405.1 uncharacterized protein LOC131433818 [Malaya genurostris]XP_058456406.1 uncharacterized protein LOC131433818 [Malaya genurostris]XP_058456407.1 uncharacterized protein LOC131433818 [Malaya genurostris]